MKFVLVLVGAGSLAFLGAVICIIASVYPRKHASFPGDNSTLGPEALMEPLEPLELTGSDSYRGENGLGGLEVPGLNHVHLGEDTGGGSAKQFSFSRLICTPVPVGECRGNMKDLKRQQQSDQPEEDWSFLRTTAEDLRQMVVQQNDQILMDQRTIRELTGKLNECESGLEDERSVPERSIGVWSGNRRVMAGDDVSSSAAAQLQTARAVEELARAIMDLKDRIEKLEAEIGPPALNLNRLVSGQLPQGKAPWRVEDLEGELERKIKLLEKERQTMRTETEGQQEKLNQGIDTADARVQELETTLTEPSFPEGFVLSFPMRTNYMYGLVRKEISEMYAFTACVWLKVREGGIGTPLLLLCAGPAQRAGAAAGGPQPRGAAHQRQVPRPNNSKHQPRSHEEQQPCPQVRDAHRESTVIEYIHQPGVMPCVGCPGAGDGLAGLCRLGSGAAGAGERRCGTPGAVAVDEDGGPACCVRAQRRGCPDGHGGGVL
ncbi:hypothetical protein KUCAC02_025057 [Chaenocephalus aceratus]|nr:hypothetical protein KUCAC02_025057 [Chaenocephalus aceratus]